MIVTAAALNALRPGFRREYQNGLEGVAPQYMDIATVVPSNTTSNVYGFFGQFPQFREWIGDRQIKSVAEKGYTIANKDWESTVGVSRNDIEDDNLGMYNMLFQEMGRAAAAHPDEMVFPFLKGGFATACYDGQYFFDTDHPVNDQVDGQGTDVSVSNVLVDGGYAGEPWYVLDTTRAVKPVVFQQRKKPQFTQMDDPKDESVFMRKEFRYGVDTRDNVGFSFWQMAFGVKAELNADNVWAAIEAMTSVKADGGRPLSIKPTLLVVPSSLQRKAAEVIDAQRLANGQDNLLYKKLKVVIAPNL